MAYAFDCQTKKKQETTPQHRYGAGIDDADLVIRFNNGPQHGFEAHVGRRTGLRILNNQWSQYLAGQGTPIRGTKVRAGC
jgi:hypothetical protein